MQNFIYALIQVLHNFGAVTVVGTAASALWLVRGNAAVQHRLAVLTVVAWVTQAVTGILFGASTFYFESHLPDIHGIAVAALLIKMACASGGLIVSFVYVKRDAVWTATKRLFAWRASMILGLIALSSAAFLRWFS